MWLDLLRDQVASRGLGPVALTLGYSKTALSLVLNGKYSSDTRRIEEAVLRAYGTVHCPFEGRDLTEADCRYWRTSDPHTTSPWATSHWCACRTCTHNPSPEPR